MKIFDESSGQIIQEGAQQESKIHALKESGSCRKGRNAWCGCELVDSGLDGLESGNQEIVKCISVI